MRFDEERAAVVLSTLIEAYRKKEGVFGQVALPQWKYLPPWIRTGSLEHARWLFCLAPFVVAKTPSDLVISRVGGQILNQEVLVDLFRRGSGIWDRKFDQNLIARRLKELGLGFFLGKNQHVHLVKNAMWLTQGWKANPLDLYRGVSEIKELEAKFRQPVYHEALF